jgi:hypothetical protein
MKIPAVFAALVLIVFRCGGWKKRPPLAADYAYLVYSLLAIYGSVIFGIAVQIVRAKRTISSASNQSREPGLRDTA